MLSKILSMRPKALAIGGLGGKSNVKSGQWENLHVTLKLKYQIIKGYLYLVVEINHGHSYMPTSQTMSQSMQASSVHA